MKTKKTLAMIASSLLASLIISACGGISMSTPSNHHPGATPTPSFSSSPVTSATPTVHVSPTGKKNGQVILTLDKTQYKSADVITVMITNQLTQTIYVNGRYYNCLLVQIEKRFATTWIPQGSCNRIQGFTPVRIQPGMQIKQQLVPGVSTIRPMSQHFWNTGTYRITFSYQLNYDPDTIGGGIHVMTSPFTIL